MTKEVAPLVVGGKVNVSAKRCPHLYAALQRGLDRVRGGWARVVDLRRQGRVDTAARVAARLMGVKGEPMTEEARARVQEYREAHKDEIAAKRKAKAAAQRRLREVVGAGVRRGS